MPPSQCDSVKFDFSSVWHFAATCALLLTLSDVPPDEDRGDSLGRRLEKEIVFFSEYIQPPKKKHFSVCSFCSGKIKNSLIGDCLTILSSPTARYITAKHALPLHASNIAKGTTDPKGSVQLTIVTCLGHITSSNTTLDQISSLEYR